MREYNNSPMYMTDDAYKALREIKAVLYKYHYILDRTDYDFNTDNFTIKTKALSKVEKPE